MATKDVRIAGEAVNHDGTDPGSASEGDQMPAHFNRQGGQFVDVGHPYNFHTCAAYTAAQTAATIAAAVTGVKSFITDLVLSADTVGSIQVRQQTDSNASALLCQVQIPANGGHANLHLRNPIVSIVGATETGALLVTSTMTNSAVFISGYRAP